MKVAIIGGGWYGCHVALALRGIGAEVHIYERNGDLLTEASGNNQFRLHTGFHYARHHRTRVQSRDGYQRFIERYPTLSSPIQDNLYAVPKDKSLIDYGTYAQIMRATGLEFDEVKPDFIHNCDGIIRTTERVLETKRAREYFKKKFAESDSISYLLSSPITDVKESGIRMRLYSDAFVINTVYDYVVNATWGKFQSGLTDVYFEPTVLFNYRIHAPLAGAITFVDGPLCSLYPTEDPEVFTLSHVTYTSLGAYAKYHEAKEVIDGVNPATLAARRESSADHFGSYVPEFHRIAEPLDFQLSIKTKPTDLYDSREVNVRRSGRVFHVMSGKIDTIFHAADQIIGMIEND